MPMYWNPDGSHLHLKLAGPPATWPKHCQAKRAQGEPHAGEWCGCMAEFQCDWKLPNGKRCDRHLCKPHALMVAQDKHLCPEHQQAYIAWANERAARKPK
jgi:hypothetical protein